MRLILICLGGALGTGARYWAGGVAARWLGSDFPYGTLLVNVLGSFLIGLLQQVGLSTLVIPDAVRLVLTIGVLGGFTTYSSFSYETLKLLESGDWLYAALNVLVTTTLCLLVCGLGLELGRVLTAARGGA
ncbi:MAG: fluoride efflux transporter CrcB [Candidatus Rokubacteria bacterium]|nr:fluoride efflux transporter CrcB [Candidatus Rokubacteria bacterium]